MSEHTLKMKNGSSVRFSDSGEPMRSMSDKHTPTLPLSVDSDGDIQDGNGNLLFLAASYLDNGTNVSEHTARCVNCHAELVEALRRCLSAMESDLEQIEGEWGMGRSLEGLERDGELTEEILMTRNLLTKLERER